jgi:hypothetical protein
MRIFAYLGGLLFLLCSCGGTGQIVSKADVALEQREQPGEIVGEVSAADDIAKEPDLPLLFDSSVDQGADAVEPLCTAGEGCFLDPCNENTDCQSGWCVQHLGEKVCTLACQEECPPGWTCQQVAGTAPDLVFVCVSNYANLCRPCASGADCTSIGGADDACLDYGAEGAFCGGQCAGEDECPWGFSCQEIATVSGALLQQCVNDTGVCPCTETSAALGLGTPCAVANDFGVCVGQRTCVDGGLSACDATAPAAEFCDGIDNDCDGDVDEPDLVDGDFVNLCHDGNDCTADKCSGVEGCLNEVEDGQDCSDGNPCTVADHCSGGACVGDPVVCDDENPCTENLCTENGGCEYAAVFGPCDDGNPCTVGDQCQEEMCEGTPVACDCMEDSDCVELDDGDACTGSLHCDTSKLPHKCELVLDSVVECPEPTGQDSPCLMSACDPDSGDCSFIPTHSGWACDDGDPCTVGDSCVAGSCASGSAANCNDGNPCTDDGCDEESGCTHQTNSQGCDDGDDCTINDLCVDGLCNSGESMACDDGNICTDDECSAGEGCLHVPNDAICDDGNACTMGDHCAGGSCIFTGSMDCDDDNTCTTDSCDPETGCTFTMNSAPCDDGDLCTTGDYCHIGACISAGELACNDGNDCTDDSCEPGIGCQFEANEAPCALGSKCTINDYCQGGFCHPGQPVICDDQNPCTADLCNSDSGCDSTPTDGPCEDGNKCTISDLCSEGECTPGEPRNCNDGNICTDDACAPQTGCIHTPNLTPCDDGDPCTQTDVCGGGECLGGDPLSCSDDVFCNGAELCKSGIGCEPGLPPNTNDGVECTFDFCDEDADVVVHEAQHGQCDTGGLCKDDYCDIVVGCVSETLSDCCGNSIVEAGEECDEGAGNADLPDTCRMNCQLPDCPDGIVDGGEACDDGNQNNGDNCKNDCTEQDLIEHFDGFEKFYNTHPVNVHSVDRAIDACEHYWGQPCSAKGCGGAQYVIGNHDTNCNNGATQRIWYFGTESCGYTCNNQDYAGWTIHPPNFGGKLPWK